MIHPKILYKASKKEKDMSDWVGRMLPEITGRDILGLVDIG